MAIETYDVNVLSGDPPVNSIYYHDNTWSTPFTTTWSYGTTVTVYMYQLICPRCFQPNWCELDKTITCKGKVSRKACNATLKAVKETVDFEVPVG
jgi:hypothetical protein